MVAPTELLLPWAPPLPPTRRLSMLIQMSDWKIHCAWLEDSGGGMVVVVHVGVEGSGQSNCRGIQPGQDQL